MAHATIITKVTAIAMIDNIIPAVATPVGALDSMDLFLPIMPSIRPNIPVAIPKGGMKNEQMPMTNEAIE